MEFLFTATMRFDKDADIFGFSWDQYVRWSGLSHLTEVVSLDHILNKVVVIPDYENPDDWNYIFSADEMSTGLFTSLDFVLSRLKAGVTFNLLRVVVNPHEDCGLVASDDFDFIGYDLLDRDFAVSALTNCGGFDETFLPKDLNDKGLIDDFAFARKVHQMLPVHNPEEFHAVTHILAIWRHKTIGR